MEEFFEYELGVRESAQTELALDLWSDESVSALIQRKIGNLASGSGKGNDDDQSPPGNDATEPGHNAHNGNSAGGESGKPEEPKKGDAPDSSGAHLGNEAEKSAEPEAKDSALADEAIADDKLENAAVETLFLEASKTDLQTPAPLQEGTSGEVVLPNSPSGHAKEQTENISSSAPELAVQSHPQDSAAQSPKRKERPTEQEALQIEPSSALADVEEKEIYASTSWNVDAKLQAKKKGKALVHTGQKASDSEEESEAEDFSYQPYERTDIAPGLKIISRIDAMLPGIQEKSMEEKYEFLCEMYSDLVNLRNPSVPEQSPLSEELAISEAVKVARVLQARTSQINFGELASEISKFRGLAEDHSVDMIKINNSLSKAMVELGNGMRWFVSSWTDNDMVASRTTKCMNMVLDDQRGKVAEEMRQVNTALTKEMKSICNKVISKQRKKLVACLKELEKNHREANVQSGKDLSKILAEDRVDYLNNHAILVEENVNTIKSALEQVKSLATDLQAQKFEYESATAELRKESLMLAEKAKELIASALVQPTNLEIPQTLLDAISTSQRGHMEQMKSVMHEKMTLFTQSIWQLFDAKKGEENADLIALKAKMQSVEDYLGEDQTRRMKSRASRAVKIATANLPKPTDEVVNIPPLFNVANIKYSQVQQIEEGIAEDAAANLIPRVSKGTRQPESSAAGTSSGALDFRIYRTAPISTPKPAMLLSATPSSSAAQTNQPKRATRSSSVVRSADERQPTQEEIAANEKKKLATNFKRQQTLKRKREEQAARKAEADAPKKYNHTTPAVPGPIDLVVEGTNDAYEWEKVKIRFVILYKLARKFGETISAEEALGLWMFETHYNLWARILEAANEQNIEIVAPTEVPFDQKVRRADGRMNWLLFNKLKQLCISEGSYETPELERELKERLADACKCSEEERRIIFRN